MIVSRLSLYPKKQASYSNGNVHRATVYATASSFYIDGWRIRITYDGAMLCLVGTSAPTDTPLVQLQGVKEDQSHAAVAKLGTSLVRDLRPKAPLEEGSLAMHDPTPGHSANAQSDTLSFYPLSSVHDCALKRLLREHDRPLIPKVVERVSVHAFVPRERSGQCGGLQRDPPFGEPRDTHFDIAHASGGCDPSGVTASYVGVRTHRVCHVARRTALTRGETSDVDVRVV